MKCKSKICDLKSGHSGKCRRVTNEASTVTNEVPWGLDEGDSARQRRMAQQATEAVADVFAKFARQYRWRDRNRERYNERQRELMRKKRAGGVSGMTEQEKGTVR